MAREIQRQIRWNMETDTGEQIPLRYRWTFLVINNPREIKRIKEKIYFEMAPIDDLTEVDNSLIKNSKGLHYDLFAFLTDKAKIPDTSKIYDVHSDGRFRKDRNLQARLTDGLSLWLNG